MSSSNTKSNAPSINLHKSISPHRRSHSSTISSPSSATSSSTSIFSSPNQIMIHRGSHVTSSPRDPRRSVTSLSSKQKNQTGNHSNGQKKTCVCSPTTHPGSFRCSFHRNLSNMNSNMNTKINNCHSTTSYQSQSHRLYARGSAMTNSLVRIGTVKGELVKRVLASLIRPSSHQQRRCGEFHPKPSRLSVMSKQEG